MTKFDKIYKWFLVGVILLILLTGLFASCKITKQIDKQTDVVTETEKINIDSIVKIKVDSIARHYSELMKLLDADVIFNDCDTIYITGKERIINTIKYVPGKGFEVSGDIKQFKLKEAELLKQIDEITLEMEMETNKRMIAEQDLVSAKFLLSKEVKKKSKSLWLLWYSLGAASMFGLYNRRKIISLFKK